MDRRDTHPQHIGDLVIGSLFCRLKQDVRPCHFPCGRPALLDQLKEIGSFGVGQINQIFLSHGFLQVWLPAYPENNLPVKISVVDY
jgi:hypothetical protein